MSDVRPEEVGGETPTVEVRAYRHGTLLGRELCETEAEAAAAVERWEEQEGVECVVEDLSAAEHEDSTEVDVADASDAYPSTGEGGGA